MTTETSSNGLSGQKSLRLPDTEDQDFSPYSRERSWPAQCGWCCGYW